jgi:hypothetical protein
MSTQCLRAVEPHWVGVVDRDAEHVFCLSFIDGKEAGEDGLGVDASGEWFAWLFVRRLCDRVVHWVEVEVDCVSSGSMDGVRGEDKAAIANQDVVGGGCESRRGEEQREAEFDHHREQYVVYWYEWQEGMRLEDIRGICTTAEMRDVDGIGIQVTQENGLVSDW